MATSSTTESGVNLVSFSKTPQANGDVWSATEEQLEGGVLLIDVLLNDLGGRAKTLYSLDDGTEPPAEFMKELAYSDASSGWGALENTTAKGGAISIVDGQVAIDVQRSPGYLEIINALAAGEIFEDSFVYAIQLGNGTLAWARVNITITGTNDGPVAHADIASSDENQLLTIDVLANDTDADNGAILSVTAASVLDGGGSVSIVDNQVVFDPGTDFDHLKAGATATVTLSYTIADEHGAESSSTVTITVTGTNDGPVAHADAAAGGENESLTIDVLANDTDADDDHVLTVTGASAPAGQGSASVVDNQVVFDPGTDFDHLQAGATASVTLGYTIADEHGAESSSTVTITVTGTNDVPTIAGVTAASVTEDTNLVGGYLTTGGALTIVDKDTGESSFAAQGSYAGSYGTFTLDSDGNWGYTADNGQDAIQQLNAGQFLTDSFTAVSSDGSAGQVVTVTIHGADEPVAITDLAFDVTVSVSGNGVPSGTFAQITPNAPGTYTYSYTASATTLAGAAQAMGANELVVNAGTGAVSTSGLADNSIYTLTVSAGGHTETFRILTGSNNTADLLTGTAADDIFFARGAGDTILGGGGDDIVFGQQGSDIIKGGAGNDLLSGGGNNDQFHFDTALDAAGNVDHITDFDATGDLLYLSKATFGGLATGSSPGGATLQASDFLSVGSSGDTAAAGSAHIIYDQATGSLYYDADGGSSANRTLFAVLDNKPASGFDANDFRVIA